MRTAASSAVNQNRPSVVKTTEGLQVPMVPHDSFTWNEIMEELSELYELLSAGEVLDLARKEAAGAATVGLPQRTRT